MNKPTIFGKSNIVDVTDYGAIPNDNNDDIIGITNAINIATTGDIVFFPKGTYLISESIKPKSGISILGSGQSSSIIKYGGTTLQPMIDLRQMSNVEIGKLFLDGNNNKNVQYGILAKNGSGHYLHDLWIKNFVDTKSKPPSGPFGINFSEKVTDCLISNNVIENIANPSKYGGGIRLSWGSSRNQVLWNTISNTGRGGILPNNGSTDLVIQHNKVSKSGGEGLGIEIWHGCDRSLIEDNTIDHWLSVGRSSNCAIRRNVISDKSGVYKAIGIELGEGCNNVFTDNLVDDGARVGISVSGDWPKEYIFWGYNTIQYAKLWGAQIQGDSAGARCHYFYKNTFQNTYENKGDPDKGHGFRLNGNCHYVSLEENEIKNNGDAGLQPGGEEIDQLSFTNNIIIGNGGKSVIKNPDIDKSKDLEWLGNKVSGNGQDLHLSSRGFKKNPKPKASFSSIATATVGQEITFTNTSSDPHDSICHVLWDFNDGLPSTEMNPTHVYTKPGTYRVTLLVWDLLGRGARAEKSIIIKKNKTLASEMWIHGHSLQVEYPERGTFERKGFSAKYASLGAAQPNWLHLAIPSPVIFNHSRLRVKSALVRFRSKGGQGYVKAIHVYDGEKKIAEKNKLNLSPKQWHVERVEVPATPQIQWGLGISILVDFGPDDKWIEISSAGCDFLP